MLNKLIYSQRNFEDDINLAEVVLDSFEAIYVSHRKLRKLIGQDF